MCAGALTESWRRTSLRVDAYKSAEGILVRTLTDVCKLLNGGVMQNLAESTEITPGSLYRAPLWVDELAADRRKDEFLATVCHELRSPLAAIQNAFRLLSSENAETAARQRAQVLMERQIRQMTQLVDDLQDISRIRYGGLHLRRERLDLRVVMGNAVETLESEIKGCDHQLTTALPDEPLWVHADPLRLEQVFVNLLSNASKYMDAGGELTVRAHRRDAMAVVRIRDSGIGIAPEALPHIFDLFNQADTGDPRSRSGLGIGLALVHHIVALHGGSVTAASEGIGKGSEFVVQLPRED